MQREGSGRKVPVGDKTELTTRLPAVFDHSKEGGAGLEFGDDTWELHRKTHSFQHVFTVNQIFIVMKMN